MNNIEQKIKKEFQQREIQPSIASWDKLVTKLEDNKSKKKHRLVYFIRIAAVFIGLLIMGTYFFNKKNSAKEFVNTNKIIVKNDTQTKFNEHKKTHINNEKDSVTTQIKTDTEVQIVKSTKNDGSIYNKSVLITHNNSIQNIGQSSNQKRVLNTDRIIKQNKSSNYDKEVNNAEVAVLLTTNQKKHNPNSVEKVIHKKTVMNSSDDDIDRMLALALENKNKKEFHIHIEDKQLQYAAEQTINTSLKYKIFNTIKSGVDTAGSLLVYSK